MSIAQYTGVAVQELHSISPTIRQWKFMTEQREEEAATQWKKSYRRGVSLSSFSRSLASDNGGEERRTERVALRPTFGCVTDTVLSLLNISSLHAAIVCSPLMLVQLRVALHVQSPRARINSYLHNYSVSTPRGTSKRLLCNSRTALCVEWLCRVLRARTKKVHWQAVSR